MFNMLALDVSIFAFLASLVLTVEVRMYGV